MPTRRTLVSLTLVCALGAVGGLALAQQPSKAEQAIKYRQAVYRVIVWNLGPIGAAMQGKAPYDKDAVARQAARIAALTPQLAEGFPPDSIVAGKTQAKPDIWAKDSDFPTLLKNLETRSAEFAEVAKSGDLAKIKPAFGELTQTCKACHDKYRAE